MIYYINVRSSKSLKKEIGVSELGPLSIQRMRSRCP